MTDRVRVLTVILDRDVREDDVEATVAAIRQIRGVAQIVTTQVTAGDSIARMTVRADVERELHAAIDGVFRPERASRAAR